MKLARLTGPDPIRKEVKPGRCDRAFSITPERQNHMMKLYPFENPIGLYTQRVKPVKELMFNFGKVLGRNALNKLSG